MSPRRRTFLKVRCCRWLLLVALASAISCKTDRLPPPRPERVEPNYAYNGVPQQLTIHGSNFYRVAALRLGGADPLTTDDRYVAVLVSEPPLNATTVELQDVALLSSTTLQATVPAGIAPGTYELIVTGPSDLTGSLPLAYTATDQVPECAIDADCHNPTPICSDHHMCRACAADAECRALDQGLASCDLSTGACLPCLDHGDCGSPVPYCEPARLVCVACLQDEHCDDGDPCTTSERCIADLCEAGPNDKDSDGDGYVDASCPGGDDCDDDPNGCGSDCHPGAPELCDDLFDNDCDGLTDTQDPGCWWMAAGPCGVGSTSTTWLKAAPWWTSPCWLS